MAGQWQTAKCSGNFFFFFPCNDLFIYSIVHLLFHFMKLPYEMFFLFLVLNLG